MINKLATFADTVLTVSIFYRRPLDEIGAASEAHRNIIQMDPLRDFSFLGRASN